MSFFSLIVGFVLNSSSSTKLLWNHHRWGATEQLGAPGCEGWDWRTTLRLHPWVPLPASTSVFWGALSSQTFCSFCLANAFEVLCSQTFFFSSLDRLIPILSRCAAPWTGDQRPVHPAEGVTTPDQCCQGSLNSTTSTGVCSSFMRRHE